jgi:hypothetical protein
MHQDDWTKAPAGRRGGAAASQARWRVAKKLLPGQPGTLKLARRYGEALVCVRYRRDARGLHRCTTIELVVEDAPVVSRSDRIVGVRVRLEECELRDKVKQTGATWDRDAKLWRMPLRAATRLGLKERIVDK